VPFFLASFNKDTWRLTLSFILLGAFCVLVLGYVFFFYNNDTQNSHLQVIEAVLAGKKLLLEVAHTSALREQGLSGRENLSQGGGMLFVFDKTGAYGFWMKDMRFSLDIIWFNTDKKIVYIEKNLSPDTYPTIFTPSTSAQYVLEVPAGFVDNSNISVGDFLDIEAK